VFFGDQARVIAAAAVGAAAIPATIVAAAIPIAVPAPISISISISISIAVTIPIPIPVSIPVSIPVAVAIPIAVTIPVAVAAISVGIYSHVAKTWITAAMRFGIADQPVALDMAQARYGDRRRTRSLEIAPGNRSETRHGHSPGHDLDWLHLARWPPRSGAKCRNAKVRR
jgi:hypothetical protein